MCRFYLKQAAPGFELYVSPVNLDPADPGDAHLDAGVYAAELARATGRFYTQGMAEDTKALSEHVLTRDEFLEQAASSATKSRVSTGTVLDGFTDGLLFYYFGNLDQVSHMMWRARDPGHPAYDAVADAPYAAVDRRSLCRVRSDRGRNARRMRTGHHADRDVRPRVYVLAPSFHLNSWLRDHGYLAVLDPIFRTIPACFRTSTGPAPAPTAWA